MDTATVYEVLLLLAIGILLLGVLWYWSLQRTQAQTPRPPRELFTPDNRQIPDEQLLDKLTGLYTAWYFIDQLEDYFHRAQTPIREQKEILLIKLVDLESMEYSFGFARTEMILRSIGDQLKTFVQTPQVSMVCYMGRGVFALCADSGCAPDLLRQLDHPHTGFRIRLVAGSALWPEQGRSASKLIRHAQTALLVSQAQHKNWLAYEPVMEPSHLDLDIISLFAESEVEGLYPLFQPQLNLRTGKIESAEALVRWNSHRFGEIPPMAFIPLLEMAGLTERVTRMMIDEAIALTADLRRQQLSCAISINVTLYDLTQTSLADFIRDSLVRHQGQASDLRLECADNLLTGDVHKLKKVLAELDALGILVALDNMGSGDFSVVNLAQLPLIDVHINRYYVGDMLTNPLHERIVRAIMAMARELGARVVAEGVEDDKTLQSLKAQGCDCAQGYVIAHPMDKERFIEFMKAHGRGFDMR